MKELFTKFSESLQNKLNELSVLRRDIRLFSGEKIGQFAGYTYYKFEIPEEIIIPNTEKIKFTFGESQPISVDGNVIEIANQFLTVALPKDFGLYLPETLCSWDNSIEINPIINLLNTNDFKSPIPSALFNPSDRINNHVVNFPVQGTANTIPEYVEAVKKILQNRVTMLWGPEHTGKSNVLALAATTAVRASRSVLLVSPSNSDVDSLALKTINYGEQLGIKMTKFAVRFDLPSAENFDAIANYSFENQVESLKEEKRKVFQERVLLLNTFWKIKTKFILHEDFYKRVQEKRNRLAEIRKQIDSVSKEITSLNQKISELENASLIDKMKKGFSKNDIHNAHEQLVQQQHLHKRLLSTQQNISNDITETELDAPVTPSEQKEFKEAIKRIDELGGFDKVTEAVENFIAVDEPSLLQSKLFIATGVSSALIDPTIRNRKYDLVIVNEAQRVDMPTLAALSLLAKEKFILAGDPFEVEPEYSLKKEEPDPLLNTDIFMYVAKTKSLHQLFEWSEKNSRWSILLKSQSASTPKLSLFISSVLFDEKINVFASPQSSGKIYFLDTSKIGSMCKQYAGKKRILPYNELHTRQAVDCVKHALLQKDRHSSDIGVILPFVGPTLYTKLQMRLHGIKNIEVGTPYSFCNRQKKAIIFDTTMSGVDYTMQFLDDTKIGEHKIAKLFNTVSSCVKEDLYVIADMSHFKFMYKDRLFTKLLMLLQAEADETQIYFTDTTKKYDELDAKSRDALFNGTKMPKPILDKPVEVEKQKTDLDFEIQMKIMAKQKDTKMAAMYVGRNLEQEVFVAVQRVLGWRNDINFLSQFVGGDLLFRSSFTTEEVIRKLPLDICENELHFRGVMEQWNLLIYEMSGGNKVDLSFFASKGPEGKIRQDIKNLHSYYSSEVEAALEEGKKKIAVEVARVFQELLGKTKPDSPSEWSLAYLKFLSRLEAYLSWISEQIRR